MNKELLTNVTTEDRFGGREVVEKEEKVVQFRLPAHLLPLEHTGKKSEVKLTHQSGTLKQRCIWQYCHLCHHGLFAMVQAAARASTNRASACEGQPCQITC